MRVVKGFVLLAIVLLIPTMAYFQKHRFETRLQPELSASVLEVLRGEGVEAPSVRMQYLDAVISGRVASDAQRKEVGARVHALPGVRVGPEGNQLHTYGWMRISRQDGVFRGEGLMPRDFPGQLPPSLSPQAGWDDEIERRDRVGAPSGAREWNEFLKYYFHGYGNRSAELKRGRLTMRGDATAGLRSDWLSKASEVVSKDEVLEEFNLHPSIYHFPGYRPVSLADATRLEQLRRQLGENVVNFGAGAGTEIPEGERGKAIAAARAALGAGDGARFVVGGHPGSSGNVTVNGQVARKRAQAVVRVLVEHGVEPDQLEVVPFGVTPGGARDNQVEIVVK